MRKLFIIFMMVAVAIVAYFYKQTESHAFGTGIGTETHEGFVQNGCGLTFGAGLGTQQNKISLGTIFTLDSVGDSSALGTIGVFCEGLLTKDWRVGIHGEYGFEDTSPSLTVSGTTITAESRNYYSAYATIGRVMPDRKTVIYGLFGAGVIERGNISPLNISLPDTSHVISGGGIDYYFNPNVKLGIQAQHWFPQDFNIGGFNVEAEQLQFTGRVSFKFSAPPAVTPFQPLVSPPVVNQRPLELK